MRRVIPLTLAGIVTFSLLLWNILSTSPLDQPQLTISLPIILALDIFFISSLIRLIFSRDHNSSIVINRVLRQSFLVSVLIGVLLYLQGLRVLAPFDAVLLILAVSLLELFFQAEKTDIRTPKHD